jgi:hypothetical protein
VNVGRDPGRVEERAAGHFLHAFGAGTGQPEGAAGDQADMAGTIPVDQESVLTARDGAWQRYL